jgi:hypothetical protein
MKSDKTSEIEHSDLNNEVSEFSVGEHKVIKNSDSKNSHSAKKVTFEDPESSEKK